MFNECEEFMFVYDIIFKLYMCGIKYKIIHIIISSIKCIGV